MQRDEETRDEIWPTFLIIGAPKAGTTSVYEYLRQHPDVYMSPVKEPQYFSIPEGDKSPGKAMIGATRTLPDYLSLFRGAGGEKAIGEASTAYLQSPIAPGRIFECMPEARIIILLRNPVDRAFSGYLMQLRNSSSGTPLSEAFSEDRKYVQNGLYSKNIARYLEVFSRNQVGVFLFEDLKRDPVALMRRVYKFLDIDESFVPEIENHNQAWVPKYQVLNGAREWVLRSKRVRQALQGTALKKYFRRMTRAKPPTMPKDLRSRLLSFYVDDIRETQRLVGLDLSVWFDSTQDPE